MKSSFSCGITLLSAVSLCLPVVAKELQLERLFADPALSPAQPQNHSVIHRMVAALRI